MARISNEFPDTAFIVAHLIGFEDIAGISRSENVCFDLSAPQLISQKRIENALQTVGSKRLFIGSDTPYGSNNLAINLET
ncbi:MAG: hypothetical protein LBU90_02475 [Bacteroidales bacterium]|nr:hypothetical protein [Bacteroidales bacterium]